MTDDITRFLIGAVNDTSSALQAAAKACEAAATRINLLEGEIRFLSGALERGGKPPPPAQWLTYRDMVRGMGLKSEKAAISRSRRENWPRKINPTSGRALVQVPTALIKHFYEGD